MANNKIFLVIILVIAVTFYISGGEVDGYYDEATNQCWPDKDSPAGQDVPISGNQDFYQCCLDENGNQIPCKDKFFGAFYIYKGTSGVTSVAHTVILTNTGNLVINNGYIKGHTLSSNPVYPTCDGSAFANAYAAIQGPTNIQAGSIAVGNQRAFSTSFVTLTAAIAGDPGFPCTYTYTPTGTAVFSDSTTKDKSISTSYTVEEEAVGDFSIAVNT